MISAVAVRDSRTLPVLRWAPRASRIASLALSFATVAAPTSAEWQYFRARPDGLSDDAVFSLHLDPDQILSFGTLGGGVSLYNGVEWVTFREQDGLASDSVSAITRDTESNYWFGTVRHGLSRFDGETWTTFTSANGLPGDAIFSLLTDDAGNVWVGTDAGLTRFDGNTWRSFGSADGLLAERIMGIAEGSAGSLVFATSDGVYRFDGHSFRKLEGADPETGRTLDGPFNRVLEDTSGRIWVGAQWGVFRYDGAWRAFVRGPDNLISYISDIVEDRRGEVWFASTQEGLWRYRGESWKNYRRPGIGSTDGPPSDRVTALAHDDAGNLWCATTAGVARFDLAESITYAEGLDPDSAVVGSAFEDSEGNVWFASNGAVHRFDGTEWRMFGAADGIPPSLMPSLDPPMLEDREGSIWLSTGGAGALRYDGATWHLVDSSGGLAGDDVNTILEDSSGALWFGTTEGASRLDAAGWTTYTETSGLGFRSVRNIVEDSSGHLWFASRVSSLVTRFDGQSWTTFGAEVGLDHVGGLVADHDGGIWVLGRDRVHLYDGQSWKEFTEDVLRNGFPIQILQSSDGRIWVSTAQAGVGIYDGNTWTTLSTEDGLASNFGFMSFDAAGNLWLAHALGGGASRFDGERIQVLTSANAGLAADAVYFVSEDSRGMLWLSNSGGMTRREPDRTAPQTVLSPKPPPVSSARLQSFVFQAAFGETEGVQFTRSFDGGPWSDWSYQQNVLVPGLSDGVHRFEVRARDGFGNVDATAAVGVVEVDATAPIPTLTNPVAGAALRDFVVVLGTASDPRFSRFGVAVREAGASSWDPPQATVLAESFTPVSGGELAGWDTRPVPDGDYELALSVEDTLGLRGSVVIPVIVDNEPPFVEETSPRVVTPASGGDVFTTNEEVHLYFPPRSFDTEVTVTITAVSDFSDRNPLPEGAQSLGAYDVSWGGVPLRKTGTIDQRVDRHRGVAQDQVAMYHDSGDGWQRVGGTHDENEDRIAAPLLRAGVYAVLQGVENAPGSGLFVSLAVTPRVFAPNGSFASHEVAIGFSLARDAPVTAKVYNRAGRHVRTVVTGRSMRAGLNVVRWDGRGSSGEVVPDGLYVVTLEALGEVRKETLAVVR